MNRSLWTQWSIASVIVLFCAFCLYSPAHAGVDEDLVRAVEDNKTHRVRDLLTKGASPDARDLQSETALMLAARNKNPEMGGLLKSGNGWIAAGGWCKSGSSQQIW